MINNRNVYKGGYAKNVLMTKKEVSISLDDEILEKVDKVRTSNEFEIKRSVFINGVLKGYFNNSEKKKNIKPSPTRK